MSANAVDRFWRARCRGDWDSVAANLRPGVRIRMPHQDREPSREEYLTFMRLVHYDGETTVERVVTGRGLEIAVAATVLRPHATLHCAGFYELREGLIEVIDEIWIVHGAGRLLEDL